MMVGGGGGGGVEGGGGGEDMEGLAVLAGLSDRCWTKLCNTCFGMAILVLKSHLRCPKFQNFPWGGVKPQDPLQSCDLY